jgi:hypothetical protein
MSAMSKIDGGLRALFKKNVQGHWTPIESGWSAAGVPDAEYCLPPSDKGMKGDQGWIEFKDMTRKAIYVRPLQAAWASARSAAGGRTTVAIRDENALVLMPGVSLRMMIDEAVKRGARIDPRRGIRVGWLAFNVAFLYYREPTCILTGGPACWDWNMVERYLRRSTYYHGKFQSFL